MKILVIIVLVVFGVGFVSAQTVYDQNCFFPRLGVPGEIDTIYGSRNGQRLGLGILNVGPAPGMTEDRVFIGGMQSRPEQMTMVSGGPDFDLHALKVKKPLPFKNIQGYYYRFGHFHRPDRRDILRYDGSRTYIYWSDENGEYDSLRRTMLRDKPTTTGNKPYAFLDERSSYSTYMTSDSVEDIVMITYHGNDFDTTEGIHTAYVAHYTGGEALYNSGAYTYPDSLTFLSKLYVNGVDQAKNYIREFIQGDWDGNGSQDLIAYHDNSSNHYYYRNEKPFSLEKLAHALRYDTLFALWQNPSVKSMGIDNYNLGSLLPKQPWDKSVDLFVSGRDSLDYPGRYVFRGGPDFGTRRLFADSVEYIMRPPSHYSSSFGGLTVPSIYNCGDLTGTGNPVICQIYNSLGGRSLYFFYVMGKATNDAADMAYEFVYGVNDRIDTIRSGDDKGTIALMGAPTIVTDDDKSKGWKNVGSILMIRPTTKIPINLNPKYVVRRTELTDESIDVYPNPVRESTTITFSSNTSSEITIRLYDVLGRVVYQTQSTSIIGTQVLRLTLPQLSEGNYILELSGNKMSPRRAKVSIIE